MEKPVKPFHVTPDGKGIIHASKKFFEREAVFAAAGAYEHVCYLEIYPVGETEIELRLSAKNGESVTEELLKNVMNALIDHQIRRDLQKEFGPLRERIVHYAFSSAER